MLCIFYHKKKKMGKGSWKSYVVQWVKDLVLLQLLHRLQLQCEFSPPGNFHMLQVWPKKKKAGGIWIGISPKKKYRWQVSMWKDAWHHISLGNCKLKQQDATIYLSFLKMCVYILFLMLSSILFHHKWLDIVPCAIQWDLIAYLPQML